MNKIINEGVQSKTISMNDAALMISSAYQSSNGILKIAIPFTAVSNKFEAAEIEANKIRSTLDNESERLLKEERQKAENEAKKIIDKAKKNAEKEAEEIVTKKKEEISKLKKKFNAKKAMRVESALSMLIKEVQNSFSKENF